jgi:hypothetical protein
VVENIAGSALCRCAEGREPPPLLFSNRPANSPDGNRSTPAQVVEFAGTAGQGQVARVGGIDPCPEGLTAVEYRAGGKPNI